MFRKIGVLKNFVKLTGKHLCHLSLFKVVGLRFATLLKKRLWHSCFPVNFANFLRTPIFIEHFRCLLQASGIDWGLTTMSATKNSRIAQEYEKTTSRLLSKHFCLQPYFREDLVSLLFA